jgi:hypothetical protein
MDLLQLLPLLAGGDLKRKILAVGVVDEDRGLLAVEETFDLIDDFVEQEMEMDLGVQTDDLFF